MHRAALVPLEFDVESPLEFVLARLKELEPEMARLAQMPGKLSAPQQKRWVEVTSEFCELEERRDDLLERGKRAQAAAGVNFNRTEDRGSRGGDEYRDTARRNVERADRVARSTREAVLEELEKPDYVGEVARHCAVASDPAYVSAFSRFMIDPMNGHRSFTNEELRAWQAAEAEQRAMTAGTGSSGGFMVPLYMDPAFLITGAGARNPFRQVANIKKITTLTYNGSTAAQVTAGILGENAAFADNTPTVAQIQIPTYKIGAYIPASFEAFDDIDALAIDVGQLFSDAKLNYEATQFATGSGSAPHGVVADVTAITASRVSPATGGAFVVGDVYKLHAALPPRFRNADPKQRAWMGNVSAIDAMRQLATANNYAAFLSDMTGGQPPQLLGDQLYEATAMDSAITTGQNLLLLGSFDRFYIVDRVDASVEFLPNILDQATGRPSGTRGFLYWWRVGSSTADVNAFRVLKL